jgi:hypothetical protein
LQAASERRPELADASSSARRVSLVNLQKLTLNGWVDDASLGGGDDDGAHARMLEAQPLNGVGELDVDGEVVRVELELVAGAQRRALVDGHGQRRDAAAVRGQLQLPVSISRRMRLERNRLHPRSVIGSPVALQALYCMQYMSW